MDPLLLVFTFSGLCMFMAFGMSLFALAACMQSARISRTESNGESPIYLTPMASDSLHTPATDSIS